MVWYSTRPRRGRAVSAVRWPSDLVMDRRPHITPLRLVDPVPARVAGPELGQNVIHVADTMADALHLAPLAEALRRRAVVRQTLVHTGAERGGPFDDRALTTLGLPNRRRALGLCV